MNNCIFCKILSGEIPSKKVYEDELCYVFEDIQPQAKVHVLLIPRKHITSVQTIEKEDQVLVGHMLGKIGVIAESLDIARDGYRIVSNVGEHSGQTVEHLHFHIMGGEKMRTDMC